MDRREFLYQRKNRCVGQILDRLERDVFEHLTEDIQGRVRSLVKAKVSSYHRDVLDLMGTDGVDIQINALAVRERDKRNST